MQKLSSLKRVKKIIKPFIPSFLWRIRRKFYDYLEDQRFKKICQTRKVECSAGAIKNFTNLEQASRIKVLFYNDWGGSWEALEPLALALSKNEDFEVIVLAMPTLVQSGNFYDLGATKALQEFSKKIHTPITYTLDVNARVQCVVGFDSQMQVTLYPETTQAHYCFTTRPYDSLRPHGWSNADIAECMKLCYIEYCADVFSIQEGIETFYDFRYLRYYDFIFSPTIFHKYLVESRQESDSFAKIIATGSALFENIVNTDFSKPLGGGSKPYVCYMPRWNTTDSHSTFSVYRDLLWTLAREDKIVLIWRPHPNMYDHYVKNTKILTQEQWDFFATAPNVFLDNNPSYFDSFKKSDILISDTSSMLTYAFLSGKPTIYTQNLMGGELNNWSARWIYQGCFVVNNRDSLEKVLYEIQKNYDSIMFSLQSSYKKIVNESFSSSLGAEVHRILKDILVEDIKTYIP
ncbi:MAG: CDP-glycerol glycerophosphotransferase family protein [Helicobacter sp.]|uniref:hypothetical protein n=1 Tax=Helicobacter sp. TaxID=218 RepID=UPI002A791331|nr:CDP-glycerol glycerophosphotransferase family protein [Helicobacter sp.]